MINEEMTLALVKISKIEDSFNEMSKGLLTYEKYILASAGMRDAVRIAKKALESKES